MNPDAVKGVIFGSSIALTCVVVGFFIGRSKTVQGPVGPMGFAGPPGRDGRNAGEEDG